jgi:hypothetical protein
MSDRWKAQPRRGLPTFHASPEIMDKHTDIKAVTGKKMPLAPAPPLRVAEIEVSQKLTSQLPPTGIRGIANATVPRLCRLHKHH